MADVASPHTRSLPIGRRPGRSQPRTPAYADQDLADGSRPRAAGRLSQSASLEFANWAESFLGKKEIANLKIRANRILKRSKKDKENLYEDMKAAYEHMIAQRNSGVTGRLEFEL